MLRHRPRRLPKMDFIILRHMKSILLSPEKPTPALKIDWTPLIP
jgi:hypothetical protein